MRNTIKTVLFAIAVIAISAASACDDDTAGTIGISGAVGEFSPGNGLVGLENATVCVYQRSDLPCTSTNAQGGFFLDGLPPDSEFILEFTKDDYVPQLGPITTLKADIGPVEIRLASNTLAGVFFGLLGGQFPLGDTGGVTFGAYDLAQGGGIDPDSGSRGYAVSIDPASGTDVVYVDDAELPDSALTETQLPGWGAIVNIDPGDLTVTFARADGNCPRVRAGYGWESLRNGDTLTVPIVAGYLTSAALLCTR